MRTRVNVQGDFEMCTSAKPAHLVQNDHVGRVLQPTAGGNGQNTAAGFATTQLNAYDILCNKAELMLSADAFRHFDSCKPTNVSCWTNLREDIRRVHHLSW